MDDAQWKKNIITQMKALVEEHKCADVMEAARVKAEKM